MTDWIDFVFCAALLAVLWFIAPTTKQRLAIPMLEDRNAEWVAAHPDIIRRIAGSRWRLWFSYALGAVSLGVLASFQLGMWEWAPSQMPNGRVPPKFVSLQMLTTWSMVVWALTGGGTAYYLFYRHKRLVPAATRRQALLERRSIADFVPYWIRFATYTLVAANILVWIALAIAIAARGTTGSPSMWQDIVVAVIFLCVLSAILFMTIKTSVARRAHVMDHMLGPSFRRWEVRFFFSMYIMSAICSMLLLYKDLTGTNPINLTRAIFLLLMGLGTYGLLRMSWLPVGHDGGHSGGRPAPQVS